MIYINVDTKIDIKIILHFQFILSFRITFAFRIKQNIEYQFITKYL